MEWFGRWGIWLKVVDLVSRMLLVFDMVSRWKMVLFVLFV